MTSIPNTPSRIFESEADCIMQGYQPRILLLGRENEVELLKQFKDTGTHAVPQTLHGGWYDGMIVCVRRRFTDLVGVVE